MKWFLKCFNQYADFSGRARRSEYWFFYLFNLLIIFGIITVGVGINSEIFMGLYFLYLIAVIIPNLSVTVRRLHDTGKSGWMILISLIPLIGPIWLFVLLVTDSQPGDNKWGPNPKVN